MSSDHCGGDSGWHQFCGASLISSQDLLTAAHCVAGRAPASLTVRLGEWDASITTETNPSLDMVTVLTVHWTLSYYAEGGGGGGPP